MNKFRPESRRYFQTGISGYIGSGNNPLVYSRRSMPSFAKLRQIYGDHLESYKVHEVEISSRKELPVDIRNRIRDDFKKEHYKNIRNHILALLISVILLGGSVWAVIELIFYLKMN